MRVLIRFPRPTIRRVALALAAPALLVAVLHGRSPARLEHEGYVGARAWGAPVDRTLAEAAPRLSRALVLAAEIGWDDARPTAARVPIDWRALSGQSLPVGLAVTVTDVRGARVLVPLLRRVLRDAREGGLEPAEVQLAFYGRPRRAEDAASLLASARAEAAPAALTLAVPPSWLDGAGLERLVRSADGFVLRFGPSLPGPAATREAIERAARTGRPFRVALPTTTVVERLDGRGRVVGRSTDGVPLSWPARDRTRAVRPDPRAVRELVAAWERDRPGGMEGVVWDPLPVERDARTWSWPTLRSVMDGRVRS